MQQHKIGVVIPCINLWEKYTLPAIKSLVSQHDLYVAVLDNGSTDETQAACTALQTPHFIYIRSNENKGCTWAWNTGAKAVFDKGCEYALIINNDVLLHPEAIDRLVERFNKERNITSFDGIDHLPISRPVAIVTCINVRGDCKDVPDNIFTLDAKAYEATPESEHPDFSGYMLSREAFQKIGEFDEGFAPAYFEDNDYHRRVDLNGYRAINHPPALFYHYGSKTRTESGTTVVTDWQFRKNERYYYAKWNGRPAPINTERFQLPFGDRPLNWTYQDRCKDGQCKHKLLCSNIMRSIGA